MTVEEGKACQCGEINKILIILPINKIVFVLLSCPEGPLFNKTMNMHII